MTNPLLLVIFATCATLLAAPCARAADLAPHSRIGAIFAEPAERVVLRPVCPCYETNTIMAQTIYAFQPRIPGYYGGGGDFYYRPYYGSPPEQIFGRDPYACTILGWC